MNNSFNSDIIKFLKELDLNVIDEEHYDNIYNWLNWYSHNDLSYYKYKHYNGITYTEKEKFTLNMPLRVCKKWGSLIFNDKVEISVGKEDQSINKDKELLDKVLANNYFMDKFSNLVELYFALGIGATTVYLDAEKQVKINYIYAPNIFPLSVTNGNIDSCAFGSINGNEYYLNVHQKIKGNKYKISNHKFKIVNNQIVQVIDKSILKEYVSNVKMFQIYKPAIVNSKKLSSPFGMSVFARCIDEIKVADDIYDSFRNEFKLGKKKIFVKTEALTYKLVVDDVGNTKNVPIFDENETEYFALPSLDDDDNNHYIKELNPELRITDHIDGLQTSLNIIGESCGFGLDYFSFKDGKVYTNQTMIVSTKSDLYKNLTKHENVVNIGLREMINAIMYLAKNKTYEEDISIDFDDSIIEDTAETKRQALLELNAGIIDRVQYYVTVYKMTEKQAIEFDKKLKERSAELTEEQPEDEDDIEANKDTNSNKPFNRDKSSIKSDGSKQSDKKDKVK